MNKSIITSSLVGMASLMRPVAGLAGQCFDPHAKGQSGLSDSKLANIAPPAQSAANDAGYPEPRVIKLSDAESLRFSNWYKSSPLADINPYTNFTGFRDVLASAHP